MSIQSFEVSLAALAVAATANALAVGDGAPAKLAYSNALATSERALHSALIGDADADDDDASALADMMTATLDAATDTVTTPENKRQRRLRARAVFAFPAECAARILAKPDKGVFAFAFALAKSAKENADTVAARADYVNAAIALVADDEGQSDEMTRALYEGKAPRTVALVEAAIDAAIIDAAFFAAFAARLASDESGAFARKVSAELAKMAVIDNAEPLAAVA